MGDMGDMGDTNICDGEMTENLNDLQVLVSHIFSPVKHLFLSLLISQIYFFDNVKYIS